jgi:UMF1 family MFS transporter
MTLSPATFGLISKEVQTISKEIIEAARASAVTYSFVLTAIWWAVLTVPLLLFVKEPAPTQPQKSSRPVREGIRQLFQTFREVRRIKAVWLFLLAYWFYIDGVGTIIRMAVDYGMSLGFSYTDLISALLITQFVGFPCALLFGRLGQRWGSKNALYVAISGYLVIVLWGMLMQDKTEFYVLAVLVGLFQGGIQALSRSYYSRLIPQDKAAQFFGFYNMIGKYAVVFGPALMGISGHLTRSPRAGIATLSLFFITGGILLFFVDEKE